MNPWKGLKNIPHNIWILAFATLINRSGTMVMPFLAIYMIKGIGLTAAQAGFVITFYGLGGLITAPFVGKLSDKLGALRVMIISLFLTGLMLFGYSFITNYYLILIYTLLWSIIGEAFRPANLSLISTESEPEQRKVSFALNRLAVNLGMSIGPAVGGFLSTINFHLLFYVDGITSILAALFLMFSHFEKREMEDVSGEILLSEKSGNENPESSILNQESSIQNPESSIKNNHKSIFADKRYLYFMFALLPVTIVFFQLFGAYPIYLIRDLGFKESIYGLMMLVNTGIIIFIEVPLNNAMSNWEDRKAIAFGALLCGIGFGAMAFVQSFFLIILTVVIWTFGEMIYFPATTTYASKISPKEKLGEYMGYLQMTFSFSIMVGPWAGTEVMENFGPVILWLGTFLFCFISSIMFIRLRDKSHKAVRPI